MKTEIILLEKYICGCERTEGEYIKKINEYEEAMKSGFIFSHLEYRKDDNKRFVIFTKEHECTCNECICSDDLPPVDNLFHTMILSHGIATGFSGLVDDKEIVKRINFVFSICNKETQICCSNKAQRIGGIGMYVSGYNAVVSNIDLFSTTGRDSLKYFKNQSWRVNEGIINERSDYSLDKWDHTEHIVFPGKMYGIWVKDWFVKDMSKELINQLKYICENNNMVFHICSSRIAKD